MAPSNTIAFKTSLKFSNTNPPTVEEVITSLSGLKTLIDRHFAGAIRNLTGAEATDVKIFLSHIESGSLVKDLFVHVVFNGEENYKKALSTIRGTLLTKTDDGKVTARPMVAGGLVVAFVALSYSHFYSDKDPAVQQSAQIAIHGDNNNIFQIGADAFHKNPEEYKAAIEKTFTKKGATRTAQAMSDFLAPARQDKDAALLIEGDSGFYEALPPSFIQRVPVKFEPPDLSDEKPMDGATVLLRAQDVDSEKSGWAGTIEGEQGMSRVRVVFSDPSHAAKAFGKTKIKADITVLYTDVTHKKIKMIVVEKLLD